MSLLCLNEVKMNNYQVHKVRSKKDIKDFTMLPFSLYEDSSGWVAPLISEYKKYIQGHNNMLLQAGPHEKILVKRGNKTVGRLLVGINEPLNDYHGLKDAYLSQFESIDDERVGQLLLRFAEEWAKEQGMNRLKGPLSLPGGDDNRGFIIDNFESLTSVMNTYNKPYYNDFLLNFGFQKYLDVYAYEGMLEEEKLIKYQRIVPLLMKRYNFRLDNVNIKDKEKLYKDAMDIKQVIEQAMPRDWEDFMPLTKEEINHIVDQLAPVADPDFIFIARSNEDDRPIGFNITLPDYNQLLKKMKGRLFPTGIFTFLLKRKTIDRGRMLVLFVIPEYQKKGVTGAIYLASQNNAMKKGYKRVEGSTIWEYNLPMLADIEGYGAKRTITYRLYTKEIE